MKNFDWTQFTLEVAINNSLKVVYDAWSKPEELERWFLSDAQHTDPNGRIMPKSEAAAAGTQYTWSWHLWEGTESGELTKANGIDHIQFTFADSTLVDINLKDFDDGVIISLTQSNIPTDDTSKQDVRLGCEKGWSFYMVNLKSVYEGGLDLRNKNPKLKPMVNN